MISAYDKNYLEKARTTLGFMLDFGINIAGCNLRTFWNKFINSDISRKFETGDSSIIAGKSGKELAMQLLNMNEFYDSADFSEDKTPEFWAGWAISYYQWSTNYSFKKIDENIPIENIVKMYSPYHEMDIRQFCDKLNEIIDANHIESNLKRIRKSLGLTQAQLSCQTAIPLRTIQQYEQKQKNINGAKAEYIIALSKALYCSPHDLLE